MPADPWIDASRMLECGLAVAAVAAPFGLVGWMLARRLGQPLLPWPQSWRVPWTGFEVVLAFLVLNTVVPGVVFVALGQSAFFPLLYGPDFPSTATVPSPTFESEAAVSGSAAALAARNRQAELTAVRGLWTGLFALPMQLGLLLLARRTLYAHYRHSFALRTLPPRVAFASLAWAVLAPAVLIVHAVVNLVFARLGWIADDHPLAKLTAARPLFDQILFFLQAGIAAPLVEEVLFRGVLLGWLIGGRSLADRVRPSIRRLPADRRVWPVLLVAVVLAVVLGRAADDWSTARGPALFALILVAGWVLVRRATRKRRTVGAVYASAALFAAVHAGVWPSPLPLFLLGLGLGWLALRTRGILVPTIVHGLFNAVSVLFVLRGGTG